MTNAVLVMRRNTAWVDAEVSTISRLEFLSFHSPHSLSDTLSSFDSWTWTFPMAFRHIISTCLQPWQLSWPFVNWKCHYCHFSLFSKESGRTRRTQKVIVVGTNMISYLAFCYSNLHNWFDSSDKTILLLSGWRISLILSADRTRRRSRSGARIISRQTAFGRWLNGENYLMVENFTRRNNLTHNEIFDFCMHSHVILFQGITASTRGGIACERFTTSIAD